MGGPARAAAHDQMGRRKGDGPRPAQRVSKREKDDQSPDIEPRTDRRLTTPLTYSSNDNSLI
jgi:hypothetical protein